MKKNEKITIKAQVSKSISEEAFAAGKAATEADRKATEAEAKVKALKQEAEEAFTISATAALPMKEAKEAGRRSREAFKAYEAAKQEAEEARREAEEAKKEAEALFFEMVNAAEKAIEAAQEAEAADRLRWEEEADRSAKSLEAAFTNFEGALEGAKASKYRRRASYIVKVKYASTAGEEEAFVFIEEAFTAQEAKEAATAKAAAAYALIEAAFAAKEGREAEEGKITARPYEIPTEENAENIAAAAARRVCLNAVMKQGSPKQYSILRAGYTEAAAGKAAAAALPAYNDFKALKSEAAAAFGLIFTAADRLKKEAEKAEAEAEADRAEGFAFGIISPKAKGKTLLQKEAALIKEAAEAAADREAASPLWIEKAHLTAYHYINLYLEKIRTVHTPTAAEGISLQEIEATAAAPEEEATDREKYRALIKVFLQSATATDRRAFVLLSKGYSIEQTADRIGKSKSALIERLQKAAAAVIATDREKVTAAGFKITAAGEAAAKEADRKTQAKQEAADRKARIIAAAAEGKKAAVIAAAEGISRQAVEKALKKAKG